MRTTIPLFIVFAFFCGTTFAAEPPLTFQDPTPQRYELTARASQIDPRARPHPEIDFVFEKGGKPADVENASVDTRVKPQGKFVIWLMGYSPLLFERVNSYGLHAIRVHYANGWFGKFGNAAPPNDDKFLGKIRLEAATGEDFSDVVNIPKPDGLMERALQFVKWLANENRPGRWEYFLTDDRQGLRWDRVIIAGASHGATTAARFANKDFKSFTPTRLFFDGGFDVIDATILHAEGKYYLIVKDETLTPLKKNLRIAVGTSPEGPFRDVSAPFTPAWVEGPSAIRIGDDYIVYFDCYRLHCYGAVRSRNLKDWEDVTSRLNFPKGVRHGTVLRVPNSVVDKLSEAR